MSSTTCPTCNGKGGSVQDTSGNGASRQNWKTCPTCNGRGTV